MIWHMYAFQNVYLNQVSSQLLSSHFSLSFLLRLNCRVNFGHLAVVRSPELIHLIGESLWPLTYIFPFPSTPSPCQAATFLLCFYEFDMFWISPISEIIQDLSFSVWLTLLSLMHLCFLLPNSSCMASLECRENPCQNSHLEAGCLWVWGCRPGRSWCLYSYWTVWGLQCSWALEHICTAHGTKRRDGTGAQLPFPNSQLKAANSRKTSVIWESPLSPLTFMTGFSSFCLCFIYVLSCQTGKLCRPLSSRSGEQEKIVFTGRALKPTHFCHLSTDRSSYTLNLEFLLSKHRLVSFCRKCPWNFDRAWMNSVDHFGWWGHCNNLVLWSINKERLSFVSVCFNFLPRYSVVFSICPHFLSWVYS